MTVRELVIALLLGDHSLDSVVYLSKGTGPVGKVRTMTSEVDGKTYVVIEGAGG